MTRIRCRSCGTDQDTDTRRAATCLVCGASLPVSSDPAGGEGTSSARIPLRTATEIAPGGLSEKVSEVFQVEEGSLTEHAASLPEDAPSSRLRELEELLVGEKRSGTLFSLVPLWGIWQISRSARHTPGEKIFLSVISVVCTVAIAFGLSTLRPGRTERIHAERAQIELRLQELAHMVEEFRRERGSYPAEDDWRRSSSQADLRFYDPWGRPFVYERDLDGYRVGTFGRDGNRGGREHDADVFLAFGTKPESTETLPAPVKLQHAILQASSCPTLDLASNAFLDLHGALYVNAGCSRGNRPIRLADGAKLRVEATIDLVDASPEATERVSPAPRGGQSPITDPLRWLPAPRFTGVTFTIPSQPGGLPLRHGTPGRGVTRVVEGEETLLPGVYWGGIRIVGGAHVTLRPGEYVLAGGGLSVFGNGRLEGEGITLLNTVDPLRPGGLGGFTGITFSAGSEIHLSAPSSGDYRGIAIFQDRANTRPLELLGRIRLDGALYAPVAEVKLGDLGGTLQTTLVTGRLTTQSSFRILVPSQSLPTRYGRLDEIPARSRAIVRG